VIESQSDVGVGRTLVVLGRRRRLLRDSGAS
jgi:hypothetical protein